MPDFIDPYKRSRFQHIKQWFKRNKRLVAIGVACFVGVFLVVQIFYPSNRLLPFTSVDEVSVGGWQKSAATTELDKRMSTQDIAVHLGTASESYVEEPPKTIGLMISNKQRIEDAKYPWYMRILPSSVLWYSFLQKQPPAEVTLDKQAATKFLDKSLGKSCKIPPKNASLAYKKDHLELVAAKQGGECKQEQALKAFSQLEPRYNQQLAVTIPVTVMKPKITDEVAKVLKEKLELGTKNGVKLSVADSSENITQQELLSWLDFSSKNATLNYSLSSKKAAAFMEKISKKVSKPAGTTYITTRDFTVVSKKKGATGRKLSIDTTLSDVKAVIEGTKIKAEAFTTTVKPVVKYKRTYTKTSTGMSALMQHYGEDHPGTFGVSFTELGGRGRSAQYNSSKVFTTASTYKLFVAYGTLKKVEDKKWKWSDKISDDRDLTQCFDDMIVKSDNPCAEALLKKLGFSDLTAQMRGIGLPSTSFLSGGTPQTTAGDLGLFLTKLERKQLPISSSSRDRLISAMKRNVYRQGIPAGANGQVADKVGFLWGLLHDAAIVYSPKGTYVLVIMTDGSSWANIADLTKKIENLR